MNVARSAPQNVRPYTRVLVRFDSEPGFAADDVPERHERRHDDRVRIRLGLRFDRAHDVADQPAVGGVAHLGRKPVPQVGPAHYAPPFPGAVCLVADQPQRLLNPVSVGVDQWLVADGDLELGDRRQLGQVDVLRRGFQRVVDLGDLVRECVELGQAVPGRAP
jgi:hypothetical protein